MIVSFDCTKCSMHNLACKLTLYQFVDIYLPFLLDLSFSVYKWIYLSIYLSLSVHYLSIYLSIYHSLFIIYLCIYLLQCWTLEKPVLFRRNSFLNKGRNILTKSVVSAWFIDFSIYFLILSDLPKSTIFPIYLSIYLSQSLNI